MNLRPEGLVTRGERFSEERELGSLNLLFTSLLRAPVRRAVWAAAHDHVAGSWAEKFRSIAWVNCRLDTVDSEGSYVKKWLEASTSRYPDTSTAVSNTSLQLTALSLGTPWK